MKRILISIWVESALLTFACALGALAWVVYVSVREANSDSFWAIHGHPPALPSVNPLLMPALLVGPPLLVGIGRAWWAWRTKATQR